MEPNDELNKKSNKVWLLVGVSAIITTVLVGGGVFWWQNEVAKKTKQEDMAHQQTLENEIETLQKQIAMAKEDKENNNQDKITYAKNWNTYKNEEYGFQLTLPPELEKYSVETYKHSDNGGFDSVTFDLPTNDSNWLKQGSDTSIFFSIIICPISIFPEIKKECGDEFYSGYFLNCLPVEKPIGQNDRYVFSYIRADEITDYPSDFNEKLFNQVEDVIQTFKSIP